MEEKNHHEGLNPASLSRNKKLSLDTYFSVFASGDYNAISKQDLNRILSIHGFKQFNGKVNKAEMVEAVSEIELKDFSRSTLGECIEPAPMSLEDVITDLTQLKWQTCPVASIRSINSALDKNMASSTCDPKASADPAGHKSEKKTGNRSMKKSDGKKGRTGEQSSSVVSTKSIDSAQYNNMASSTCGIEDSVVPGDLKSEKKKLQTGSGSNNKSGCQSGRSGELAISMEYSDVASARYVATMDSEAEPARKQIICDQSGKSASSGGDNSVVQKDYGAVVTGASCSSPMAEKVTALAYKKKRKVTESLYYYMATEGMPNLSKELGITP